VHWKVITDAMLSLKEGGNVFGCILGIRTRRGCVPYTKDNEENKDRDWTIRVKLAGQGSMSCRIKLDNARIVAYDMEVPEARKGRKEGEGRDKKSWGAESKDAGVGSLLMWIRRWEREFDVVLHLASSSSPSSSSSAATFMQKCSPQPPLLAENVNTKEKANGKTKGSLGCVYSEFESASIGVVNATGSIPAYEEALL
jgi:hypothetical protein